MTWVCLKKVGILHNKSVSIVISDTYCKYVFREFILVPSHAAWQHIHTQLIEYYLSDMTPRLLKSKLFSQSQHTLQNAEGLNAKRFMYQSVYARFQV